MPWALARHHLNMLESPAVAPLFHPSACSAECPWFWSSMFGTDGRYSGKCQRAQANAGGICEQFWSGQARQPEHAGLAEAGAVAA